MISVSLTVVNETVGMTNYILAPLSMDLLPLIMLQAVAARTAKGQGLCPAFPGEAVLSASFPLQEPRVHLHLDAITPNRQLPGTEERWRGPGLGTCNLL